MGDDIKTYKTKKRTQNESRQSGENNSGKERRLFGLATPGASKNSKTRTGP